MVSKKRIVIEIDYDERTVEGLDKAGREKLIRKNRNAIIRQIKKFFDEQKVYEPGEVDEESLMPLDFISMCDLSFDNPVFRKFILKPKNLSFLGQFRQAYLEPGDNEINQFCEQFENIILETDNFRALIYRRDDELNKKFVEVLNQKGWDKSQFNRVKEGLESFQDFFKNFILVNSK